MGGELDFDLFEFMFVHFSFVLVSFVFVFCIILYMYCLCLFCIIFNNIGWYLIVCLLFFVYRYTIVVVV